MYKGREVKVSEIAERTGMSPASIRAILAAYLNAGRKGVTRWGSNGQFHCQPELYDELFGAIEQARIDTQRVIAERVLVEATATARVRLAEAEHARARAIRDHGAATRRADQLVDAASRLDRSHRSRRRPMQLRPLLPPSVRRAARLVLEQEQRNGA